MRTRTFSSTSDLPRTLAPLRHGPADPTIRLAPRGALRATRTPEGPCTLRLRSLDTTVEATAWGPGSEWALEFAPQLVGVADDPHSFRPAHPLVRDLHRRAPGLRMCRSLAVHECLVATIIEQKVTSREAHRSYGRLVRAEGEDAPGPGGLKLPPSPERLASLPYHRYHPFGIERRRAELVRAVSKRSAGYERLARTEPHKLEPALRSMPGIGPWSVAHVLQAVLGDPDAVIVGDYHMPHIVAWVLAGEPRGDDERMLELLEPFSGQRGRALRLLVTSGIRPPAFGPRRKLRRIETI